MNSEQLNQILEKLSAELRGYGRVIVAYSGGVDSTLLAALAREALGKPQAPAVTADSPSLSRRDLAEAEAVAERLDLEHVIIPTQEVANPAYRVNSEGRCYFCKQELFVELEALAQERGIPVILYGAIGDDVSAQRPGQRAARERGVRAPLQELGLAKREVRELARQLGLPNWDRPQNACLSSRIPHGMAVTEAKLRQIEEAETVLTRLEFRVIRVRHLEAHARIEVGREEVARFQDPGLCETVLTQFQRLGFASVGIARTGYQPGGANLPSTADEWLLRKEMEGASLSTHPSH